MEDNKKKKQEGKTRQKGMGGDGRDETKVMARKGKGRKEEKKEKRKEKRKMRVKGREGDGRD